MFNNDTYFVHNNNTLMNAGVHQKRHMSSLRACLHVLPAGVIEGSFEDSAPGNTLSAQVRCSSDHEELRMRRNRVCRNVNKDTYREPVFSSSPCTWQSRGVKGSIVAIPWLIKWSRMGKLCIPKVVLVVLLGLCSSHVEAVKTSLDYASKRANTYVYETKYFDQKVDHFDFTSNARFKQRYLINDSFWDAKASAPIFFYTGNEGDIEAFAQNTGLMWEMAEELKALVVFAEHRYYGQSLPFGNQSTTPDPKKIGYLTSEQALADYAQLVSDLKQNREGAKDSAVIAFGGSYGGMLAAWFRIKFPHLCNGAIAGSAPVAQFSTPCDAFGRIVTSDYAMHGKKCVEAIRQSWRAIDQVISTDEGTKWLNNELGFCKPLTKGDGSPLKNFLNDMWTNIAMVNYPYPTSFIVALPGNPIKQVCKAIMSEPKERSNLSPSQITVLRMKAAADIYVNTSKEAQCWDLGFVNGPDISDLWDYQACSEMVMPLCTDNENDMFEKSVWNLTKYTETCQRTWNVTPDANRAEIMYGGRNLQGASNIVFSNGLLDPWSSGGILRSISSSVIALLIPEGAHHLDLRASHPLDPPSVKKARDVERMHVRKWVKQAMKINSDALKGPQANAFVIGDHSNLL